jgi:hypothetical protein
VREERRVATGLRPSPSRVQPAGSIFEQEVSQSEEKVSFADYVIPFRIDRSGEAPSEDNRLRLLSCWRPLVPASGEIKMRTPMNMDLEQSVRERAYQIWEREGRVHGRHEAHWHSAKLELTSADQDGSPITLQRSEAGGAAVGTRKPRAQAKTAEPKASAARTAPSRRRSPAPATP